MYELDVLLELLGGAARRWRIVGLVLAQQFDKDELVARRNEVAPVGADPSRSVSYPPLVILSEH